MNVNGGAPIESLPDDLTVDQFSRIHSVYMDIAGNDALTPSYRTTMAEDLSRLCAANPVAYKEFLERQRLQREASANMLRAAGLQDPTFFLKGDKIGTVG
jgi:hypothetical protein